MPPSRLAHYEIIESIGAGGMGEVHRAHDTKLGRDVALKLLPLDFASDPERAARFRREAQLLASLQHAHIASIYGLEEASGQSFLVMELAEGEDLARRLKNCPISVEETIQIAEQIAEALEEAHEKGIVHRDLKPANIMVSLEGEVKVLDFGLAKVYSPKETSGTQTDILSSPTLSPSLTNSGMILGTAAYMSPEQARGKTVDRRADIWAFGVVVYEMLTGKRLFTGETVSDCLAAVLRTDPDWDALPESTPAALRELMRRCLQRDPRQRLRDIGEARYLLESYQRDPSGAVLISGITVGVTGEGAIVSKGTRAARIAWGAAILLFLVGALLGSRFLARPEPIPVIHANLPPPEGAVFSLSTAAPGPPALASDGRAVAFSARFPDGRIALFVRRLDSGTAVEISGTEDAAYPFWSPNGDYIGFFSQEKLKRVALSGGLPITLCPAPNGKGGSWSRNDVIVFAPSHDAVIHRVAATGGGVEPITRFNEEENENSHRHPFFLPDQNHFLFTARVGGATGNSRVMVGSLDGQPSEFLIHSDGAAEYSSGYLLFVKDRVLLAALFDPSSLTLDPSMVPLVEDILVLGDDTVRACYSASENGTLVYLNTAGQENRVLEWLDRQGNSQGELGDPNQYFRPRISPDGAQVAVEVMDPVRNELDIWLVDTTSGIPMRFTFEDGDEGSAVWSPDGSYLYYYATSEENTYIARKAIEGTSESEEILIEEGDISPSQVTPDGRWLILDRQLSGEGAGIWALPLDGKGELRSLVTGDLFAGGGHVSPDGRWLAYHCNESGEWDIYVVPFPEGGRKHLVSREESVYPLWSGDGGELRFIRVTGELCEVEVDGSGSSFRSGKESVLFLAPPPSVSGYHLDFDPSSDAVLMCEEDGAAHQSSQLEYVSDWPRGLMR